jgi:hypothetical protein
MSMTRPVRTDLVISMTLAELFLMLVFVVWYGFTPEAVDNAARIDRLVQLERELADAKVKLAKNEETIRDISKRLEWWRSWYPEQVPYEGKAMGSGGLPGRGFPKCDLTGNVVAEGSVRDGAVAMRVVARPDALAKWFSGSGAGYPAIGASFTGLQAVNSFLNRIGAYNLANPCRWDYRLAYVTDGDYKLGRETFEGVFYASRLQKVSSQ